MALILQDSTGKQYKIAGLGESGKSAYEFSKEAGYTGTEEEFAEDLNSIKKILTFGAQTVASSPDSWADDITYPQYPFMASVPLAGVTSSYIPIVTFSVADAISGNLAPVADTYDGGIRIYAKERPAATVNIASVVCIKGD